VGVSQTLRRWTEGATYIRQGDHHVGHWPTFLVQLTLQLHKVWQRLCAVASPNIWRLSLLALLTCLTGEGCGLHHLISSTFRPSACQLSVVAPFRLPVLRSGTAYQMTLPPLCPCQLSGAIWRHTYSAAVTTLTDTACTYSDYSGPRGCVAA